MYKRQVFQLAFNIGIAPEEFRHYADVYKRQVYHHKRPGFCFQEGAKIAPLVEKYCKVPANMALWKAHNFIEIAFDVLTAAKYPDLQARDVYKRQA